MIRTQFSQPAHSSLRGSDEGESWKGKEVFEGVPGGWGEEGSFYQLISLLSLNSKLLPWSMSHLFPLCFRESSLPSSSWPTSLPLHLCSLFIPTLTLPKKRNICLLSRIPGLLCPKTCLPSSRLVGCTPLYFYMSRISFYHSIYHFHVLFQSSASWSPSANQLWTFWNQSSCLICSCTMRA